MKPTLIFDGDCGFCRYWVDSWKERTGDSVEYGPSQEIGHRFPSIPPGDYAGAVQFVDTDEIVYSGAEAVFKLLTFAPRRAWLLRAYESIPGIAPLSEAGYRLVADHRVAAGRVNRIFFGRRYQASTFYLSRWLFLRALGLIFVLAFMSFWWQLPGLIGEHGVSPAAPYLDNVEERLGSKAYWRLPTLFWLEASDATLMTACAVGAFAAAGAVAGVCAPAMFFVVWVLYLSLLGVGQAFLSFQWDILLLETAFLAVLLASFQLRPRLSKESAPSPIIRLLLWWLLFRLMFSSGVVKLEDVTWRNLTAMNFHYETQPLPTALGYYAHQLPEAFQKFSVVAMFVIELVVPFFIFMPRRIRHFGAIVMIGFQGLLIATGNFAYFNWLTIALCILLLDDPFWRGLSMNRLRLQLPKRVLTLSGRDLALGIPVTILIGLLSVPVLMRLFAPTTLVPAPLRELQSTMAPLRIVNNYGLFAYMTTKRPEIVIEGSRDGETWLEYSFKWKPGDLEGKPRRVAPYQPRLDWQMWFAALSPANANPWFEGLMVRLLQGSPEVLALLKSNPFPDRPPKYVRAIGYQYHFTDLKTLREEGRWWSRERRGEYQGPIALRN